MQIDPSRVADAFALLECPAARLSAEHVGRATASGEGDLLGSLLSARLQAFALVFEGHFSEACKRLGGHALSFLPLRSVAVEKSDALRADGLAEEADQEERTHWQSVGRIRQDLHAQGRSKQALLSQVSIEEAAALITSALHSQAVPLLVGGRLNGMRDYLSRSGLSYAELPAPKLFPVAWPRVFGSSGGPTTTAIGRALFVGALSNASVRHRSSLIRTNEDLLLDVQDDELDAIKVILHVDPRVMDVEQDDIVSFEQSASPRLSIPEAVHLGGVTSRAFGHWVVQFLPKLFGARYAGSLPPVPILIDAGMPPSHREALAYFLGSDASIIEIPEMSVAIVDKLWLLGDWLFIPICPAPDQDLGPTRLSPPPHEMAAVIRRMTATEPEPSRTDRRLFLAREDFRHRRMVNHDRIAEVAEGLGFEIVYLERHSFREQMAMMRSAQAIVGPDGSSHLMGMFARPATKITILSHGFMENNASLAAILAALGIDIMFLQGRCVCEHQAYRRFSDYEIDEDDFRQAIDR